MFCCHLMINIFWDASQWCITKLKERPWLGYLNNMPWMQINVIDYEQWRFWISKTFLVMNKSLICYPFLKKCWSLIAIIIIKIEMVEIWIYNSKPLDQGNPCYYYIKYFQFVHLRFGIRHDVTSWIKIYCPFFENWFVNPELFYLWYQ